MRGDLSECLCLVLLLLQHTSLSRTERFEVLGPVGPVVAVAGEDVVLPCYLKPNISALDLRVEWFRLRIEDPLVHLYENHENINERQIPSYRGRTALFPEELKTGNTSLKLTGVRGSDDGQYKCLVQSLGWYDDSSIHIRVKAVGTQPLISIEGRKDGGVGLVCESTGWHPEPEVVWLDSEGHLLTAAPTETHRDTEGFFTVRGHVIVHESNTNKFTCQVLQKEFNLMKETMFPIPGEMFHPAHPWKVAFGLFFSLAAIVIMGSAVLIHRCVKLHRKKDELSEQLNVFVEEKGVLDVFELNKYNTSDGRCQRVLPFVKFCKKALLTGCKLTEESCRTLASVLQSADSHLRELDLSNNDLGDSGVKELCVGLKSEHCKLQTLRLSGCQVTEGGCASLASALRSNPSHLRELDLSYNHPGDSGVTLLSAGLEDPSCKLQTLNVDHGGECRIKPGLLKYACKLTLDPNTAHRNLSLSEGNRKVTRGREVQPYPDLPERFESYPQVLCVESLSGRSYWEVQWGGGEAEIGVTYKGIRRKGKSEDCVLGHNDKSWRLVCSDNSYSVCHNKKHAAIPAPPSPSRTVGLYLDWPAGSLSFYSGSYPTHTLLYRYSSTFTQPLCPGFGLYWGYGNSVTLWTQGEPPLPSSNTEPPGATQPLLGSDN